MHERVYGSNMFMITLFIFVALATSTVFNIFVFGWLLSPQQFTLAFSMFAAFIYYISFIKRVYLYQDEIVFRKIFSTERVSYDEIHKIILNEKFALTEEQKQIYKRHSDSIDYFVLLDKSDNVLMSIYTGLIGDEEKQIEFIQSLIEKNEKILTE